MSLADDLERSRAALRMSNPAPYNAEAPPEALAGDTTPVELHYVRSNFAVPTTHDGTLEVRGAVDNPTKLTLDDLRAMPAVERAVTLECAGNGRLEMRPLPVGEPWGDYAVSTARWKGALLHEVLEHAHPAADGVEVRFEGADHGPYHLKPVLPETNQSDLRFVRSLALAHATDPAAEILIAYEMNGQLIAAGEYTVRGKAWSGTGPVTDVHVSFTGEGDWHPAKLEPLKDPYQWQDWSLGWQASDIGRHSLRARATDAAGNVQPDVPPWNRLGYGNNAIEVSYVDVR